jgi:predicted TIM-barrel fold metal-dependent hydrolase
MPTKFIALAAVLVSGCVQSGIPTRHIVPAASYGSVFTKNAIVLVESEERWWKGEALISQAVSGSANAAFVPKAFAIDGRAGYISGNIRSAASGLETQSFLLGLRKEGGKWRIGSEMKKAVLPPLYTPPIHAEKLIQVLDDAGIQYGVVHSLGYWFGNLNRDIPNRHAQTMAENDWTVAQTAKYPDRLIPFCGVNPLAEYALSEIQRCAAKPAVRGMKIHFNNSGINLASPEHVEKLRHFFRASNTAGLALAVHVRGPVQPFIDQVLPEAPDVPVQIAHMASGPSQKFENAEKFADAIQAGKPGTRNLYFDWTQALAIEGSWRHGNPLSYPGEPTPEVRAHMAGLMRRLGLSRILYGTDMPLSWNPWPREWWTKTILPLPLTDDEIRDIADNVPPYIR